MTSLEWLEQALALDRQGREREAIPHYRRALAGGLEGDDLHAAMVSLASSLESVGKTQAAIRVLREARRRFPRDVVVILSLALAHYHADQRDLAVRQLANALLNESKDKRLAAYQRVLARKYHAMRGQRPRGRDKT